VLLVKEQEEQRWVWEQHNTWGNHISQYTPPPQHSPVNHSTRC